ncbi:MAG: DUF1841 family protein [Actinomycetota bacterium]|nr:DUF1841 family protein [Actinomycetota bacterium]
MSPKSRERKKRPGTRKAANRPQQRHNSREDELAQIFDRLLCDAGADLAELDDPLQAEMLVSELVGTWAGRLLTEGDPEVIFGEGLIGHAERAGTPAALAVLRGLAELGTDTQRRKAAAAAAKLAGRGVAEPGWTLRPAGLTVTGCWAYRDIYGDQTSVLLNCDRDGQSHGVMVLVDHTLGGLAKDAFVADDAHAALADIRALAAGPTATLQEVTRSEARGIVEPAFAVTDMTLDPPVADTFNGTRALTLARLRTMPEPAELPKPAEVEPTERRQIVADFLASDRAAGLADRDAAERCAELIVDYGCDYDRGHPLRVSPMKTEVFLRSWLPRKAILHGTERAAVPDVVRAWVRWAGERAGLPEQCLTELDEAAEQFGAEFPTGYADPERANPLRAMFADLDGLADADEVQEAVDRRMFTMPFYGTTIGDEDHPRLDPGDEDDRHLLIVGEHPEYHEALDDPTFDGEVDGANPRLHITVHEVVANQLWNDDPPEAWQAAQRLTATGADRHEVLHQIGEVVIHHLYGALTGEHVDPDAYRRELDNLGRGPLRR